VVLSSQKRISGAEVEMRVRRGDDVTLYSDCVWKSGLTPVWFRNFSDQHCSSVIMATDIIGGDFPRYSFLWNPCNNAHDLLIKNVTESDLGLYYCGVVFSSQKRISGAEVEMRDDVTLYCGCVLNVGFNTVWLRNSKSRNQSCSMITIRDIMNNIFPRYSFLRNPVTKSHNLLIKNITESDLGLYHCAVERKENSGHSVDVHECQARTIQLGLL
ncbi:uncharacterized protein DAT39_018988, partial [Clarias magur]